MAAVLTPYLGVNYQDKKKKTLPLVTYILRETLRLGTQNHYLDGIPALFSATDILKNPDLENNRFKQPSQRVAIGKASLCISLICALMTYTMSQAHSCEKSLFTIRTRAPTGQARCCFLWSRNWFLTSILRVRHLMVSISFFDEDCYEY